MKLSNKLISMFALALALSMTLVACEDDPKPPVGDDAGNGGGDDGGGGGGGDGGGGGGGGDGGGGGGGGGGGACTGAADLATIGPIGDELSVYGEESDKTVAGVATDCAVAAFFGIEEPADRPPAIASCIDDGTADGVTADCVDCYVATALCGIENCVASCAADANSEACTECLCENDCISEFETCSGRPSDRCDGL